LVGVARSGSNHLDSRRDGGAHCIETARRSRICFARHRHPIRYGCFTQSPCPAELISEVAQSFRIIRMAARPFFESRYCVICPSGSGENPRPADPYITLGGSQPGRFVVLANCVGEIPGERKLVAECDVAPGVVGNDGHISPEKGQRTIGVAARELTQSEQGARVVRVNAQDR